MKSAPFILFISFIVTGCNNASPVNASGERPLPANMVYNYECLSGAAGNDIVADLKAGEDELRKTTIAKIPVTDDEQSKFGDDVLADIRINGTARIDRQDPVNEKLQFIMHDLLRKRPKPSVIKYGIYLLDDRNRVNAFTFGGKIFITKAIVAKCKDDDELYAIIGHEIGHNEKGHVKANIQELKASRKLLGKYGDLYVGIKKAATAVFNQQAEVEADYYGLGLVYMLGRKPCAILSFWDDMAKGESEYSRLQDFLRSHPYSAQRAACLRGHIDRNFEDNCK